MRMGCSPDQVPETDPWPPHAILARPIDGFRGGSLLYHEGTDRQGAYKGVFGWVDGIAVALKTHEGALTIGAGPERRTTLYLSDRILDADDAADCVDIVLRAFEVEAPAVVRLGPPSTRTYVPLTRPRGRPPGRSPRRPAG